MFDEFTFFVFTIFHFEVLEKMLKEIFEETTENGAMCLTTVSAETNNWRTLFQIKRVPGTTLRMHVIANLIMP